MKGYKKIVIAVAALLLVVVLANIGLNYWIEKKLPALINEKNNSPYYITYEDIDVSLFNSSIVATNIVVVPKDASKGKKAGLYASIKEITVNHFKLWDILFSNKIRAKQIRVIQPDISMYGTQDDTKKPEVNTFFSKVIVVSEVSVEKGSLRTFDFNDDLTLQVHNVNAEVDGILVTDAILERKIPFDFDTYSIRYDSLYYKPNKFYHVTTKAFTSSKSELTVKNVAYVPEYSRAEFVKAIPAEKDLFAVNVGSLTVTQMDWGFKKNRFFFHSGAVILNTLFANIYRAKMPPDDLTKKPLYSQLLREIDFDLKVDTLAIRNSSLEYEEEKTFEKGAGLLTFRKFNLYARHINSGFGMKKVPDVQIKVNCLFMGASPMNVNWRLNPLDRSDSFNINGSIRNFPAEQLTPFTKPYMNVTAKGILNQVSFDITGNDDIAKGEVSLDYDDLKFTIYRKKDSKKKNKILSAVANLFVKNDSKEEVKDAEIEVERTKEKSFFNFFWKCVAEGLKKILV
ncbi:MAG TPA: hypothetical protein VF676_11670 [Flavobacterium sp.]|jgi:hypothetical protein